MNNWNPSDGCPICGNNLDTEDGALYECCKCNKTFTGDGSEVIEAIETEHEQLSKYIQAMALLSTVLPWRKIDVCDPMSLVREVMDDIAAAQERERWIPVTERLPEKDGYYLAFVSGWEHAWQCEFASPWWYDCPDEPPITPTHWCELPTPPEADHA